MRHLRSDWDGIQDTRQNEFGWNKEDKSSIEHDEPVFLLRAKDPAAGAAVYYWACVIAELGGDPDLVARVKVWSAEMTEWKNTHYPEKLVADTPKEVLK